MRVVVGAAYLIHRQTKKFGKGEREIPHHSQKAKKYYPAEDESKPRKVSFSALDTAPSGTQVYESPSGAATSLLMALTIDRIAWLLK